MTEQDKRKLGAILWAIADQLRDPMNADGFRHYMLSFLFLCYLSDNYGSAGRKSAYTF
jgi:type I restriction enzyme M protein